MLAVRKRDCMLGNNVATKLTTPPQKNIYIFKPSQGHKETEKGQLLLSNQCFPFAEASLLIENSRYSFVKNKKTT